MLSQKKQSGNGKLFRSSPEAKEIFRSLKRDGCRVLFNDDGSNSFHHPCIKPGGYNMKKMGDVSLLNDAEKEGVADNYLYNYAQDLRDGEVEGTIVIMDKLECKHLGPVLSIKFVGAGLHNNIFGLLNQCKKESINVLRGSLRDRTLMPFTWIHMINLLLRYSSKSDDYALATAKNIGNLVRCISDEKRQLFGSNCCWYLCLEPFLYLLYGLVQSEEGLSTMLSHNGLLPFLAQATCLSQSDTIEREAKLHQVHDKLSTACEFAQETLEYIVDECWSMDIEGLGNPLEVIARTPLSRNDTNSNVSIIVGMIRMLNTDRDGNGSLVSILDSLLLTPGFVDSHVIAELVKLGKASSDETFVLVAQYMVGILGLDEDYKHIKPIDSRYAAAIRHGFFELVIWRNSNYTGSFMEGLNSMAMHNRTAHALRRKGAEFSSALTILRSKSPAEYDVLCSIVNDTMELGKPLCCNCLKECEKKKLQYCEGCNIECYCSLSCQTESWCSGHEHICKTLGFDDLIRDGVSENYIKRCRLLATNLLMAGCRFVRDNMEDILNLLIGGHQYQHAMVVIDFGIYPPDIRLERQEYDQYSDSLRCAFISRMFYGFDCPDDDFSWDTFIPASMAPLGCWRAAQAQAKSCSMKGENRLCSQTE